MLTTEKGYNWLKMLKQLPFLTTHKITFVVVKSIRQRSNPLDTKMTQRFLYSSRDRVHDGVYVMPVSVSMAKLWALYNVTK